MTHPTCNHLENGQHNFHSRSCLFPLTHSLLYRQWKSFLVLLLPPFTLFFIYFILHGEMERREMRKNRNNFYITKHDVKYFPFPSLSPLSSSSPSFYLYNIYFMLILLGNKLTCWVILPFFFFLLFENFFCSLLSTRRWTRRMDEKIILHSMMRDYHDSFCYYLLSTSSFRYFFLLLLTNCSFITIHFYMSGLDCHAIRIFPISWKIVNLINFSPPLLYLQQSLIEWYKNSTNKMWLCHFERAFKAQFMSFFMWWPCVSFTL